jgi:Na+/melibiose symporter-like transporter
VSSEERELPVGDHQAETDVAESVPLAGPSHPVLLYTLARIALLAVTAGVLYLLGARSWLLLVLALFVSGLLSYIVLGQLRDAMSARMDQRMAAARVRREAAARAEDDLY